MLELPRSTQSEIEEEEQRLAKRELIVQEMVVKFSLSFGMKRGEGNYDPDYAPVIMDGMTSASSNDIDKMTKPQMVEYAGAINMTKTKARKTKVEDLRQLLKAAVASNPSLLQIFTGSASALQSEEAVNEEESEQVDSEQIFAGETLEHTDCPVLECEGRGTVPCAGCSLTYCSFHEEHFNHVHQQLKDGRKRHFSENESSSSAQAIASSTTHSIMQPISSSELLSSELLEPPVNNQSVLVKRKAAVLQSDSLLMGNVDEILSIIRSIEASSEPDKLSYGIRKLRFDRYDVQSLQLAADSLQVDISEVFLKRRTNKVDVLTCLLTKYFCNI